ncbi:MAG: hypothetical protein V4510_08485 [bacterium]
MEPQRSWRIGDTALGIIFEPPHGCPTCHGTGVFVAWAKTQSVGVPCPRCRHAPSMGAIGQADANEALHVV